MMQRWIFSLAIVLALSLLTPLEPSFATSKSQPQRSAAAAKAKPQKKSVKDEMKGLPPCGRDLKSTKALIERFQKDIKKRSE
ncbi:MAG: hypothetical protein KDD22_00065, partial [Bdellovibrionales bacterium]|nr:hypothetical protein [Bdellovibrionales bacterium]